MTTWQERNKMREILNREKIKEELLLDAIHWTHHITVQFPSNYNRSRYIVRRELDIFCRRIDRTFKVRLIACGMIVYKYKHSPHAHLVLSSIPAKGTKDLSEIDPQDLLEHWHFDEARITTDKHWSQTTVQNYITGEHNMNLDGSRMDEFDIFTYNQGKLQKFAETYGKYRVGGHMPPMSSTIAHIGLAAPGNANPISD